MSIQERMRRCRLIEQMKSHKEYSKRLGLENQSTFYGEKIYDISVNSEKREDGAL